MAFHAIELVNTSTTSASVKLWVDISRALQITAADARAALTGAARNNPVSIAAKATELLQVLVDTRILLTDLPLDDPNRTTDPKLPYYFWATFGGLVYLVSREATVRFFWDGSLYNIEVTNLNG